MTSAAEPILTPVDVSFFESAGLRIAHDFALTAPPERVWAAIALDPAGWGHWFPGFSPEGRFTTPPPHGVGSEREVFVGPLHVVETIIAWEQNRLFAFTVTSGLPGTRSLAERYAVAPGPDGGTVVSLTFAAERDPAAPPPPSGGPSPVDTFGSAFEALDRHLAS